jgi:hypothetical protein
MDRPRDSRTRLICILGSAVIAVLLMAAPAALAEPIAGDEYALDLPGAADSFNGADAKASADATGTATARGDGVQGGVVGETLPDPSLLSSMTSMIGGPLVIAAALGGLALISFGPRSPRSARTR